VLAVGAGVERVRVGQPVLTLIECGRYAERVCVPEELVMELRGTMSY